jgi:MFS family permease
MVKSFGVPPEDISYYAGITAASFSLSQFFTGIAWGRASDKIGRKPVIIMGLLGTLTSLLIFVWPVPFASSFKDSPNL